MKKSLTTICLVLASTLLILTGCNSKKTDTKHRTNKHEISSVQRSEKRQLILSNNSVDNKAVTGYIYRIHNDYLVMNAKKGFIKNANAMKEQIDFGNSQSTNLYFNQQNTFVLAKEQAKGHSKNFKLAYGEITYKELPETDTASISFRTINSENLDKLPKIKIYKIDYQVISK